MGESQRITSDRARGLNNLCEELHAGLKPPYPLETVAERSPKRPLQKNPLGLLRPSLASAPGLEPGADSDGLMRKRLLMLGTVGVTVLVLGLWFSKGPGLMGVLGVTGGEPTLVISPDRLEFDATVVGVSSTGYVVATNMGEERIVVNRVRAEGDFKAPPGFSLEPGESAPVTVVFEPSEVGPAEGRLVLESEAFSGGEHSIPLSGQGQGLPQIAIEPLFLDFGDVAVGSQVRGLVTVRNPGEGPLRVEMPAKGDFAPEVSELLLEPGAEGRVEFSFRPSRVGRQEAQLDFRSNAVNYGLYVQASGTGIDGAGQPAIQVTPGSLDFGEVRVGTTARKRLEVRNVGSDPLDIVNLAFPSEEFRGSSRSRRIPVGGHLSFPITFSPKSAGERFAPLVIYSNDPEAGVLTVALVGAGSLTAPPGTDEDATPGSSGNVAFLVNDGTGASEGPGANPSPEPGPEEPGPTEQPPFKPRVDEPGSETCLQKHCAPLLEFDLDVQYDPASGQLVIDGTLPPVDLPLGQTFYPGDISGVGFVENGEVDIPITVPLTDRFGNEAKVEMTLTTGTTIAIDENNIPQIAQGQPLSNGYIRPVGLAKIPTNGPLGSFVMSLKLNLQVQE